MALTTYAGASLDVSRLTPGSLLDVETTSRHYRIECLGGCAVRISGHPHYCPEPVPAQLQGSLDSEGLLESGIIGAGMKLMLYLDDVRPLRTSKVVRIRLDQPPVPS